MLKGKVYRGSSCKVEDRKKSATRDLRDASRYSQTSRQSNNLTPTSREERTYLKQDFRAGSSSGIFDIIDKNVREKQ